MKRETMAIPEYESPQMTVIKLVTEQMVLAGSSDLMLDNMFETNGEWAD